MATIHPYKGYLNTQFHFYANGTEDIPYSIFFDNSESTAPVLCGVVTPSIPHSIKLQSPGEYKVIFKDGSTSKIIVEDGYKFGGGRLKTAYIFHKTPWCMVVMRDRTYFYNKETEESFVETISPDSIEEISHDYILLKNNNQCEITLFSLCEQKPILCFSDLVCLTEDAIVWQEDAYLVIYSLSLKKIIHRIASTVFSFDNDNSRLIFGKSGDVSYCELSGNYRISEVFTHKGQLITFVNNELAIYCLHGSNGCSIKLYNLNDPLYAKEINVKGTIARINGAELINIESRRMAMYQFDLENSEFPEASIEAEYLEFRFYPCSWDIFYEQRDTKLNKTVSSFLREEEIHLKSIESELDQPLKRFANNTIITENRFVIYNDTESFVRSQHYSAAGYINEGRILVHRDIVIRILDGRVYMLSRNGYWDYCKECDYDYSKFEQYGIVKDNKTGFYKSFRYNITGKDYYTNSNPVLHIELGNSIIQEGGKIYFNKSELKKFSIKPLAVSPDFKQGIIIEDNKIFLLDISLQKESRKQILSDIYDASEYHNVILGEDGTQILYRNSSITRVTDIVSGETFEFGNMSFVQQVNGMRPHFQRSGALQPRIVNPVTGLMLDSDNMKKYNFLSPDGTLYADTRLNEYIEYYWRSDNKPLSYENYHMLLEKYTYPWQESPNSLAWKKIKNSRKAFIQEHFEYLNDKFPSLFHNDPTGKKWEDSILDEANQLGALYFLKRIIGKRGIAYIRRTYDDSVFAKIELGEPLTYINYVSFSYDSKYMALAGYRGDCSSSCGGLFLIYNLIDKSVIAFQNTGRAVWVTAFSKLNALASYTSNPFTFFAKNEDEYLFEDFKSKVINGKSVLTFSPDGLYFALSQQGYISKYDKYGDINSEWGHQPSSLVEIRYVGEPEKQIMQFHDLSDAGIAEVAAHASNVAAVSFSNDNKRLMMVGNDGVVIIRNLHLNTYAGE